MAGTRRKPNPPPDCPVERYARDVVEGRTVAGELVILACQRHLNDLQSGVARGLRFDHDAAQHAIQFFGYLRHSKGEWAGQVIKLELWQQFLIGCLFGWMRWSEEAGEFLRRFRVAYDEIARKNGKSTIGAGIALYLMIGDGEPGADVYSVANNLKQARIVFQEAKKMVKASRPLRQRIGVLKDTLSYLDEASKFEPLPANAQTLDGLNIHGGIADEVHKFKGRDTWDLIETATGSRRQALLFAITTAGTDQQSVCWELHEYAEKVLKGTVQDDTFFAFIAAIDKDDDWTNPACWIKANPNLGISVKRDDLERKVAKAREMPAAQNNLVRLHFNRWTQQANRWIDLALWDKNAGGMVKPESLLGRTCYGGLDLSSVSDITAWVKVFPSTEDPELLDVQCHFWVPEDKLHDEENRYHHQYQAWARAGFLHVTPGNAVDYDFVKAQILADAQQYQLTDFNIDRLFQAHQLAGQLKDEGLSVIGMGQGFLSMAMPMKEFERRLLGHKLRHGGNPVLRWMADNVSVKTDPAGNLKPDKATSQGKIDGIVALVMALDRATRHQESRLLSESEGVLFL